MTNIRRAILAILIAVVATLGFSVGLASAHANAVTGTSACQTNGTYTVTWKVANDFNLTENISFVSGTGGGTLSGLPASIAASPGQPFKFTTVTQSGVPGTATSASLTIHGAWSDQFAQNDSGSVTLAGTCKQHNTPAAPTYTPPTCSAVGAVVAPDTTAVHWTFTGTASVTATATAKTGFVLDGQTVYGPYAVGQLTGQVCLVISTPVAPAVTRTEVCAALDSFTAGPTVGVVYSVTSGTLAQGQVVQVVATPAAGYKFAGEQQSITFTIEGGAVEECPVVTTTVPPTTVPPTTVPPTTQPPAVCVYDTNLPADSPLCVPPTVPTTVPPTAPPTTVTPPVLPATGSHAGGILIALILVAAGSIAALVARRPKHA